jgi:lysozyme
MANYLVSKKGLMELIGHEAIVQTRYRDSVGVWTIGVGHTRSAGAPNPEVFRGTMSIKDVFALFKKDLQKYVSAVNSVLRIDVSQTEFDALVSFHFNTGGIKQATLVKSLNNGERRKAAQEFMNWIKPPEIKERRQEEQRLFANGVYAKGGRATVYTATAVGKVEWGSGTSIDLTEEDV